MGENRRHTENDERKNTEDRNTAELTKSKRPALIGSQINASLERNVKMHILKDVENIWTGENVKRQTANSNIQRCAEIC